MDQHADEETTPLIPSQLAFLEKAVHSRIRVLDWIYGEERGRMTCCWCRAPVSIGDFRHHCNDCFKKYLMQPQFSLPADWIEGMRSPRC